jgi:hypothetical protein
LSLYNKESIIILRKYNQYYFKFKRNQIEKQKHFFKKKKQLKKKQKNSIKGEIILIRNLTDINKIK